MHVCIQEALEGSVPRDTHAVLVAELAASRMSAVQLSSECARLKVESSTLMCSAQAAAWC